MVCLEYRNAYSEILEILRYIPEEELNKIPKGMLKVFKENANPDYFFHYNPNETLQEQNVSKTARYIIAVLFRDYWATPRQREKILTKEKWDLNQLEQQKREKYNQNAIFNNKYNKNKNTVNERDDNNSQALIEYKKSFWKKIKEIFRR